MRQVSCHAYVFPVMKHRVIHPYHATAVLTRIVAIQAYFDKPICNIQAA